MLSPSARTESILAENSNLSIKAFPGWGYQRIVAVRINKNKSLNVIGDTDELFNLDESSGEAVREKPHIGLNVLKSVSIAGCDLLGSCLYTAGICAGTSGKVSLL